jgi:hypothetical protein
MYTRRRESEMGLLADDVGKTMSSSICPEWKYNQRLEIRSFQDVAMKCVLQKRILP